MNHPTHTGSADTGGVDLDQRPILVFWESTRACGLACRHCRAEAQATPVPGELTTAEGLRFIDTLAAFGKPSPILIITGGDVLMRPDLDQLVQHSRTVGVHVALAPSVTPLLTDERLQQLRAAGVKVASISLDGASAATHEGLRGIDGHFPATIAALDRMRAHDFVVQVNTVVTADNVHELPTIVRLIRDHDAAIWEVFFLVNVGRGSSMLELGPDDNEDVCHFLYDAAQYGFVVRTVEGPMFRRVVRWRDEGRPAPTSALYSQLSTSLVEQLGSPTSTPKAHTKGTRDGRGIIFVSATGEITPAGFLPIVLGNVRTHDIVEVYRDHPMLRQIRAAEFGGACGRCEYRELCGGSRSRAYACTGDPLAEDPACAYAATL
ncbi:MAG: TIGR04053 family radical SAM/SPASM domain-containing protein [Actinomycetota bacterium]|nr:TIGR04053 family radical SAM/SPASM domain-containing protein [Actinomycetota bacterium]